MELGANYLSFEGGWVILSCESFYFYETMPEPYFVKSKWKHSSACIFFFMCLFARKFFFINSHYPPPPPRSAPTHKSNVVMKAGRVPKHVILEDREVLLCSPGFNVIRRLKIAAKRFGLHSEQVRILFVTGSLSLRDR